MQPNLFDFATSELSQDAFICWLLSWAKKENKEIDAKLHEIAVLFIKTLFQKRGKASPKDILTVEVTRQDNWIDVLVIINDEYAIVIEDKTSTSDGLGKLKRYIDDVSERNFPFDNIIPIYFKTGDQSDYETVRQAGYTHFCRNEFLEILNEGKINGIKNQTYLDYFYYLQKWEDSVNSFKTLPIQDWHWSSWIGFYKEMQQQLKDGTWNYVPNQSGGFLGFWWHFDMGNEYNRYIQLEERQLCFKLEVPDYDSRSKYRNLWSRKLVEEGKKWNLPISKPNRFGHGNWMTAAVLKEEYRKTNQNGLIQIQDTVKFLKNIEKFLDGVIKISPTM